ncbi:DUF4244 domain-containing protein [Actinophytocola sp.]|uniref:DUF4244 domain-containing protein n=1 Tax=Actinophytocola sp. TaxID=1872138 RepID=UPI002ED1B615
MFHPPRHAFLDDTGSTTETAILMIVTAALATVLLVVVRSGGVQAGLTDLVERALNFSG